MLSNFYQSLLILFSLVVICLLGVFFYFELFPQYKEFQNTYVFLEKFKAEETGTVPPSFKKEVKQVVLPTEKGPEHVERCISCHVALKFEHFSPTKVAKDINGEVIFSENGKAVLEENENYVWKMLEDKISSLKKENKFKEADKLESLKTLSVGDFKVDVTKALKMHPLLGKEIRPLELHPMEEFGCIGCHGGNPKALTFDKAHGPALDGQYEPAHMGEHKTFLEKDKKHDPLFSKAYNNKPGHALLFQTTPLLIGGVLESSCAQCHSSAKESEADLGLKDLKKVVSHYEERALFLEKELTREERSAASLIETILSVEEMGVDKTLENLKQRSLDYTLAQDELNVLKDQFSFLQKEKGRSKEDVVTSLFKDLNSIIGRDLSLDNIKILKQSGLKNYLEMSQEGSYYKKRVLLMDCLAAKKAASSTESLNESILKDDRFVKGSFDPLKDSIHHLSRGKQLFISQGCYACHEIKGFSRGKIGPELTVIGKYYPWYIKESIVWPQANLKTSTMPNFKLDHEELEDVMTFLMAQKGKSKVETDVQYNQSVKDWELSGVMPWEKPLDSSEVGSLDAAMEIFSTQGCASCHKLKGFEGSVVFTQDIKEKEVWFRKLFPEGISGKELSKILSEKAREIDSNLKDSGKESFLESLEKKYPDLLESYYTSFKFAQRSEDSPAWKQRVDLVRRMFIQQYGVGRDIAPRLHWSGVYRDQEWLMGHFKSPSDYTAKSIMPPMPFDESKFYALSKLLLDFGMKNKLKVRQMWNEEGFDPELAYQTHCAACHGENLKGSGVISEMLYPIPKNLTNAVFLRELTKERAVQSILHGVKGTPMPPWGEVVKEGDSPVLNENEAKLIVDWIFEQLPGSQVIEEQEIKKWNYSPKDVIKEIEDANVTIEKKNNLHANLSKEWTKLVQSPLSCGISFSLNSDEEAVISQIFDKKEPLNGALEESSYFIKDEFYTKNNILQGEALFIENCSDCHGKTAQGDGLKASVMLDAKPRMLVNVPWIDTRDDLRLLRSIKYGVPGTSMTPWGDKTNILQRIQIVTYIRSMIKDKEFREELDSLCYSIYDKKKLDLLDYQASLEKNKNNVAKLYAKSMVDVNNVFGETTVSFEQLEKTKKRLLDYSMVSTSINSIKELLTSEKEHLKKAALGLLNLKQEALLREYLSLIKLFDLRLNYSEKNGFEIVENKDFSEVSFKLESLEQKINDQIALLEKDLVLEQGKVASIQRTNEIKNITDQIKAFNDLKALVVGQTHEALKCYLDKKAFLEKFNQELKSIDLTKDFVLTEKNLEEDIAA